MKASESKHPFYRPLWRRVTICVLIGLWAAFEVFASRDPMWMVVTIGMLAYAVWTFLIAFPKGEGDDGDAGNGGGSRGDGAA